MNVWVIARNTFREAIRDKILYVILVFAIITIAVSKAVGWVMVGEDIKVMTDIGFSAIAVFSVLIAVFVGTSIVHREIEKKTLYTVLARPVNRWEFLLGKYAGLMLTILLNMAIMSVVFLVYLKLMGMYTVWGTTKAAPPPVLTYMNLQALVLTAFELAVVTAIAVFFSAASTPVLSAIMTTIAYVAGHTSDWIIIMADIVEPRGDGSGSAVGHWILTAVYYLVPNLEDFNLRNLAVHSQLASVGPLPFWRFADTMLIALCWCAIFMTLAVAVFRRREL